MSAAGKPWWRWTAVGRGLRGSCRRLEELRGAGRNGAHWVQSWGKLLCLDRGLLWKRSNPAVPGDSTVRQGFNNRASSSLADWKGNQGSASQRKKQKACLRALTCLLWTGAELGSEARECFPPASSPFLGQLTSLVTPQHNTRWQRLRGGFRHKDEIHPCATTKWNLRPLFTELYLTLEE